MFGLPPFPSDQNRADGFFSSRHNENSLRSVGAAYSGIWVGAKLQESLGLNDRVRQCANTSDGNVNEIAGLKSEIVARHNTGACH